MNCNPRVMTDVRALGRGPGVTVDISQRPQDTGGWFIDVYALFGVRRVRIVTLSVTPLAGRPSNRILYVGGAPGATDWEATVRGPGAGNPAYLSVTLRAAKELTTSSVVST